MTRIPPIIAFVLFASACGDKSGEIAACAEALENIEASCSAADLSDMQKKTCDSSKRAIATLREAAAKTGKTEIAADGCRKQAETIARMVGAKPTAAEVAKPAAKEPAAAGDSASPEPASGSCAKLAAEIEAACADPSGFSAGQKMICNASQKSGEVFARLAAKNPDVAEKGCAKTLADWSKKGGLKQLVSRAGK